MAGFNKSLSLNGRQSSTEADRGYTLSLPSCRSIPGGLLVLQNGWGWGGVGQAESLRC